MISGPHKTKMTDDVQRMVDRWERSGYEMSDMPHELLCYAMCVAFQHSHDRKCMLDKLNLLIAHIENVKEKVAVDWVNMLDMKRQTVTRIQNDDQHPKLFP